jgi:molybdopterin-guanine dinucleotide biosynthesis protein A
MTERVAAIVLAGGRSSRFGRDKLAEPIAGRPMLDHVVERLRPVATDIVVVGSTRAVGDIPADVSVAQDDVPFGGPLAGLAAGLRSLDPALERVLVVGGDMPTLVPAVLERLVSGIGRREAAVLADADGPRPLPLAVRRSVASPAAERVLESGERRLRALLGELDVEVIPPDTWQLDDPTGETLRDVDVPGDLPDQWPEARP